MWSAFGLFFVNYNYDFVTVVRDKALVLSRKAKELKGFLTTSG